MKTLNNRLPEGSHALTGSLIDRSKPISFRLNGERITGFAGDTVLTAALASGLDTAGSKAHAPVALSEDFALAVMQAGASDRNAALPMARLPASDGMDLISIGARARRRTPTGMKAGLTRLFYGPQRSLGHMFDRASELAGPWVDMPVAVTMPADVAIVGGGVAGMSAAIASARLGERIVLIERGAVLGGEARYFGGVDGEETPADAVARLREEIAALANVTVLTLTEAFALYDREIRAHQVAVVDGVATGRVVGVDARRLVIATGAFERLPVFTGNRTPGVIGAVTAFRRADHYGLWQGKKTLIATGNNPAYRLATMASDAGVTIQQVIDTRIQPRSRFIDYSNAYGIKLGRGLRVEAVTPSTGRQHDLSVGLAHTGLGTTGAPAPVTTEQLIVSGGWQPALALWYMAGGESRWNSDSAALEALGRVDGVMLAGSVLGLVTTSACMQSGFAAIATLFSRRAPAVADKILPAVYEAPDDRTSVAAYGAQGLAYLDSGVSLTVRPAPPKPKRFALPGSKPQQRFAFADHSYALTVGDIAAGVQIGAIPEADAAVVAQERCVIAGDLIDMARQHPNVPATEPLPPANVPAYLTGRLSAKTSIWRIAADDGRSFEPGCTIHVSSDRTGPFDAVGIVLGSLEAGQSGAYVLLGKPGAAVNERLYARDLSGPVSVKLLEKLKPEAG